MIRKLALALVVVASLAACGAEQDAARRGPSPATEPHRPATADERHLARRYFAFADALAQRDADRTCAPLARPLARSYRCGHGLRLPRELRHITVGRHTDAFALSDRAVPGTIQLSSASIRGSGGALIVFFTRRGHGWRVTRVMLGGYG